MTSPAIVRTSTAELYDAHVLKNYARAPLTLVRGRGAQVWDDAGNAYLDFTSGIAVSALGHCHPYWVAAVQRQAAELIHVSNLFRHPNQGELARRLVGQAGPGRVFFCNSGAEANEALIKLARLHGVEKAGGVDRVGRLVGIELAECSDPAVLDADVDGDDAGRRDDVSAVDDQVEAAHVGAPCSFFFNSWICWRAPGR